MAENEHVIYEGRPVYQIKCSCGYEGVAYGKTPKCPNCGTEKTGPKPEPAPEKVGA